MSFAHRATDSLEPFDVIISTIQKDVRRGLLSALFWTAKMLRNGYTNYIVSNKLLTLLFEDIGLGWADGVIQWAKLCTEFDAIINKEYQGKSSTAGTNLTVAEPILQFMYALIMAPKTRLNANTSRIALEDLSRNPCTLEECKKLPEQLLELIKLPSLEGDMIQPRPWFRVAMAIFTAYDNITDTKTRTKTWENMWSRLPLPSPLRGALLKAFKLSKSPRLVWMHALWLLDDSQTPNYSYTPPKLDSLPEDVLAVLNPKTDALTLRSPLPDYAKDIHTTLGTSAELLVDFNRSAKAMNILEKVKDWTEQQIAVSHSPPEYCLLIEDARSHYARFYREGALIKNKWKDDPYLPLARNIYVEAEQRALANGKKAKPAHTAANSATVAKNIWSGDLGRIFKVLHPSWYAIKPKIKRKATGTTSERATKKLYERPNEKHLSNLPVKLPSLSAETLAEIAVAPWTQKPCGRAKKITYMLPNGVYKGPYDVTSSGDVRKLRLMISHRNVLVNWKISVPEMELYQNEKHVWVKFQQLASTNWRTKTEKVTDFTKNDKSTMIATLVDASSLDCTAMSKLSESIWKNERVVAQFIRTMMGRWMANPPIGDTGPWNTLFQQKTGIVYCVDFEEAREKIPTEAGLKWFEYLFTKKVRSSIIDAIETCMESNESLFVGLINDFQSMLTQEQKDSQHWQILFRSIVQA